MLQAIPPPVPPPPPPGLPIDDGLWMLLLGAIMYGSVLILMKNRNIKENKKTFKNQKNYTIMVQLCRKSNRKDFTTILNSYLKRVKSIFLVGLIFFLWAEQSCSAQLVTDQFVYKDHIDVDHSNKWAIGIGASNFIMHGDLRSIGTGEQGNFWNFGAYAYIDKMFNPILGLELKINYHDISGGAQYFSEIYEVLYTDITTINNNLFFEGRAFGAELNMIFSFSNLFRHNAHRWHLAGYLGMGYQQYNSKLYEKNTNGTTTLLVDFGVNPARQNRREASSVYLSTQIGVKYRLSKRIDIEFRPSWYFNYEDHLDATISNKQNWETYFVNHLGFTLKLGKQKTYTIWGDEEEDTSPKTLPFTIIDTDQDGVMDQLDDEPNTPREARVYGNGVAVDSDNDKIPDYKDKCPLIAGPMENDGCPILKDSDNDGVMDKDDLCPMKSGSLTNKGCPKHPDKEQIAIFKFISQLATHIYFETGKWELTPNSKKVLDKIGTYIEKIPQVKFKIEGHTDNRDTNTFNMSLSQKRAEAVVKYLIHKGVKRVRLIVKGYGETRPRYSNETSGGRQLNRRVEIKPLNDLDYDP